MRSLLLTAYALLFPPLILLATRRSFAPQVFGWWTYRTFAILVAACLLVAVATVLVWRVTASESNADRLRGAFVALRRRPWLAMLAALAPAAGWLALTVYLVMLGVAIDTRLLIALIDLALLASVWPVAVAFVGRPRRARVLLGMKVGAAVVAALLATLAIELTGNALQLSRYVTWQVNPRNLDVRFETDDFDVRVTTNVQGLREPQVFGATPNGAFRIAVVGDSYTFGWGVEDDEAYGQIAETTLHERYGWHAAEIVNVGRPGASLQDYLKYTQRYVTRLQPDVVVVGFLVGNDCPVEPPPRLSSDQQVARALENHLRLARPNPGRQLLDRSYTARLLRAGVLPWLRSASTAGGTGGRGPLFGEPNPLDPAAIARDIEDEADSAGALRRYQRLQRDGWVDKGLAWRLNPWLIRAAILHPAGPADSLAIREATFEQMQFEWKLCAGLLDEIRQACADMDADLLVLALPNAHLVSQRWVDFIADAWGAEADPAMTESRVINDWLLAYCAERNVPLVDPLDEFRARTAAGQELYFTTDDHLNRDGQQLVGEILAAALYERYGRDQ